MQTLNDLDNFAAHLDACSRPGDAMVLRSYINELRPYFEPSDSPFDECAPGMSEHFRAWSAICEIMREVRGPNWSSAASCPRDAAVAAIRSMAAQCSAQPTPAIPIAWPKPVERRELDMLLWSIGYLQGIGFTEAAKSLDVTLNWLRDNGCDQQIR